MRSRLLPAALALLAACAEAEEEAGTCALDDAPELLLVRTLSIATADDAGVSAGFDLDGMVTEEGAADGCGIADYTSPAGQPGIDNAFSRIVPTLDATEARVSTIESLVQQSIDSGELLIAFEIGGVDSWESDDCVAVEAGQAAGDALMGTDGLLLDGQTFERELDSPTAALTDGRVVDGVLRASGLSIDLPVQILDVALELPIRGGELSMVPDGEDTWAGVLAGAIPVSYIYEVASGDGIDDSVAQLLGTALSVNADLDDEEGAACAAMSMTLSFQAVGAYYYD